MYIKIYENRLKLRARPKSKKLNRGAKNRADLIFPNIIEQIIDKYHGENQGWALRNGEFYELEKGTPNKFFKELISVLEKVNT